VIPAVPSFVEGDAWLTLLEAKAAFVLARAEADEVGRVAARARHVASQAEQRYLALLAEAGGQLKLRF